MSNQSNIVLLIILVSIVSTGCDNQQAQLANTYDSAASRYSTPSDNLPETTDVSMSEEPESNAIRPMSSSAEPLSAAADHSVAQPETTAIQSAGQNRQPARRHVTEEHGALATAPQSNAELLNRIRELEDQVTNLKRDLHSRDQVSQLGSGTSAQEISPTADFANDRTSQATNPGIANYARKDLNRLIRRYERAKVAFRRSEDSYKVDHMMTLFKGMEFLVRDTPQGFNTLPEKDKYAFRDFQEAADDLVPELEFYLADIASNAEATELSPLLDEAQKVVEMSPTGTGNRMLDFLGTFKDLAEEHQRHQQR